MKLRLVLFLRKSNCTLSGVAMTSEVIKVFVRVRPPISQEVQYDNCIRTPSSTSITLLTEKHDVKCAYDRVFSELDGQDTVFEEIKPLLNDVLGGMYGGVLLLL